MNNTAFFSKILRVTNMFWSDSESVDQNLINKNIGYDEQLKNFNFKIILVKARDPLSTRFFQKWQ